MKTFSIQCVLAIAVVAGGACAAHAAITQGGSGVDAFFGSQGTAIQATNPNTLPPFTSPGTGPLYTAGLPLPSLPAPPTPLVMTSFGNPFQPTASTSTFNDGGSPVDFAAAKSTIADNYNPLGTSVADVAIDIPYWRLEQGPGAPLYAFEQLNFYADYLVLTSTPLAGSTPSIPLYIEGTVVSGGNVQFDAQITYTWYDVNADGTVDASSMAPLGTLRYQWLQAGGGSFNQTLYNTGTLSSAPSTAGLLELTGYAWIAGDPFEITITPEPATLSLLALGALAIMRRRRRAA